MTTALTLPLRCLRSGLALAACAVGAVLAHAEDAPHITPPKDIIGFNIGDDYHMANNTQITTMWKKWATESDRMKLVSIGNTEEGRPEMMAIITSPENMKHLDHYREISVKLARARLTDEEAHQLSREGKAVVWVDGGLHASETVNSQQLAELVYEMVSRSDQETMRFLKDTILLAPIANPDGVEVVADWYMRNEDEKKRTFIGLPRLYNKYIGHDNNRDSLMNNMKETTNMDHVLWIDWIPQIMYNTHQSGPEGEVVFIPPYRDPFNYDFDPLLPIGIERVGFAMQERLASKNMPGFATRSVAPYSTWWNGGLRNACFWHNQIGILTEIIGSPTPMEVALVPDKQLPQGDWAYPIRPQVWHYSQSVHYDVEIAKAALDYGSRNSETLLYNIYRMGKDSILRGSQDTWTITPKRIEALNAAARAMDPTIPAERSEEDLMSAGRNVNVVPSKLYDTVLHDPAFRDPRGYIISPDDQNDFPTAVKFINVLLKQGVEISKATASFTVKGKTYPAGSYIVKGDQAFRPVVMDFFERQDHPNDLAYPGGPPKTPYDITGWTIVKQMGVACDKIYDGFDGPFEPIGFELQKPPVALVSGPAAPAGWLVSHKENDSFILTNRLLKAGCSVYWLKDEQTVDGKGLGTGTVWVAYSPAAVPIIERAAKELGVAAHGLAQKPAGDAVKLKPIRIGLVDLYGGLMPSGWLRWMFEQYEFPFEVVYPQILDAGGLKNSFDVIVFPSQTYATGARSNQANTRAATRNRGVGVTGGGGAHYDPPAESIPEEYRSMLGNITVNKTIPPLKKFIDEGGTIIAIGSSATIGQAMGLPVTDHLVGKAKDGTMKHLGPTKFYIPGSVLEAEFDNTNPIAYGMPKKGYVFFDSSPVFDIDPAAMPKTNTVVWFDTKKPLYSGWAVGQEYLDGGKMGAEASLGQGKLVLISLEATFRGTPHANFKLLFNSLYYGSATAGAIE
jgi:hypothetical protein